MAYMNMVRKNVHLVFPVLFALIFMYSAYLWIAETGYHNNIDHCIHYGRMFYLQALLSSAESPMDTAGAFFSTFAVRYPQPPYILNYLFYQALGPGPVFQILSNAPFIMIFCFSVYLMGLKIEGWKTGMLALILSMAVPLFFENSVMKFTDFHCSAMVMLCIYLLSNTDSFSKPKETLIFFAVLGMAMMVKWFTAFALLIPVMYCFIRLVVNDFNEDRKELLKFLGSILVILLIVLTLIYKTMKMQILPGSYPLFFKTLFLNLLILALLFVPIYCRIFPVFPLKSGHRAFLAGIVFFFMILWPFYVMNLDYLIYIFRGESVYGFRPLYYFEFFFAESYGPFRNFLLMAGILWHTFSKNRNERITLLIVGIVGYFSIMTLTPAKEPRYMLVMIGAMALVSVYWIFRIRLFPLRLALAGTVALLSLVGLFGWHSDMIRNLYENRFELFSPSRNRFLRSMLLSTLIPLPERKEVFPEEIATAIINHLKNNDFCIFFLYYEYPDMDRNLPLFNMSFEYFQRTGNFIFSIDRDFHVKNGTVEQKQLHNNNCAVALAGNDRQNDGARLKFTGKIDRFLLFYFKSSETAENDEQQHIAELCTRYGIEPVEIKPMRTLSRNNVQLITFQITSANPLTKQLLEQLPLVTMP